MDVNLNINATRAVQGAPVAPIEDSPTPASIPNILSGDSVRVSNAELSGLVAELFAETNEAHEKSRKTLFVAASELFASFNEADRAIYNEIDRKNDDALGQEKKVSAAKDDLAQREKELTAAEDKLAEAQKYQQETTGPALKSAETAKNTAKTARDDAKTARDDAKTALDEAQDKLNAAEENAETTSEELDAAKQAVTTAETNYDTAETNYETAQTNYETAETNYGIALADDKAAKGAITTAETAKKTAADAVTTAEATLAKEEAALGVIDQEILNLSNGLSSNVRNLLLDELRAEREGAELHDPLEHAEEENETVADLRGMERSPIDIIRDALRRASGDFRDTLETRRENLV